MIWFKLGSEKLSGTKPPFRPKFNILKEKKIPINFDYKMIYISERGCFGDGDPGMVDEAGHPLVSIKEAATIVKDYR